MNEQQGWLYLDPAGKQVGPMSESEIRELYARRVISDATLLWREGMPGWIPFRQAMSGQPGAPPPPLYVQQPQSSVSALAIVAFVSCFIFAPLALILGIIALVKISKSQGRLTGQVLAILSVVWGGIWFLIVPAIAVPAFINYMKRAKTSEATLNVGKIYNGIVDNYGRTKELPQTTDWTPATPCCEQGEECVANPSDWEGASWRTAGFAMTSNHLYQYRIVVEGDQIMAQARGDLDCDGQYSLFERAAIVYSGDIQGSSGVYKADELE